MSTLSQIFKNRADFDRYSCSKGGHLLVEPVQLSCGHRLCRACADELIASEVKSATTRVTCPAQDCNEEIDDEDGAYVNYILM